MKKIFSIFILVGFLLSGCQTQPSAGADVLNAGQTFQPPTNFYEVYAKKKELFDSAYQEAKTVFIPDRSEGNLKGILISVNLSHKAELAGFFESLSKKQSYQTIVLLGSTDFKSPKGSIFTTASSVKTPSGFLLNAENFTQKLTEQNSTFILQDDPFMANNHLNLLLPFLKKSFPNVTYVPILINPEATDKNLNDLAESLKNNLPAESLVIAQTTIKTSQNSSIQSFQIQFLKNVLENFDLQKFPELPLNQTSTTKALVSYLSNIKAQTARTLPQEGEKPPFIQYFLEGQSTATRNIFLVSFGDIMLDRDVRRAMNIHGLDYPFLKMDEMYLKTNDLLLANLEGPVAKKAIATTKSIAFHFLPDIAPLLKKYYFDVLSAANNHAFDMGQTGYNDTYELISQQDIAVFGNPRDVNDQSAAKFEIQDRKIAFLGLDDVDFKIDKNAALEQIKKRTAEGYEVIPFIHWGIEYVHRPNDRQRQLAHEFIDAGAIAIIAHHPHVVQSYETYKDRPIFYSLGNAIFDQYFSNDTQEGLSLAAIIGEDQVQIFLLPIRIDRSQMRLMNPEEKNAFLQRFATYGEYSEEEKSELLEGKIVLPR